MKILKITALLSLFLFAYQTAYARGLADNNNPHLWVTNGETFTPIAQISMAFKLEDAKKICKNHALALTDEHRTYFCVSNIEHWVAYAQKFGKGETK